MAVADLPPPLLALLDAQFGVVGRCQLLEHVSHGTASGLVRRGAFDPVERGVYRVRGGARHRAQAAMAAVLRARPEAVTTGPLVLALLNVQGFETNVSFEILVREGRAPTNVAFAWRRNPTPEAITASIGALPIVSPTAALVDCARWLERGVSDRQLRAALDSARWRGLVTTDRLRERCQTLGQADPGAAYFLELLEASTAISESEPERILGGLLGQLDPAPEPQVWVTPRRRVDWFFRLLRLAVEYLGRVDHATTDGRSSDSQRDEELAAQGILVVPVTAADLRDPQEFLAWMRLVLRRRARELGIALPA